jgi:UDP-2,3-diacylglucosamine pyrophosphatase LpxH
MVEEFDKIFVISDLHLGGPPGRRAFRETAALAGLIDTVRTDGSARVALVLNGDIVDFLAAGPDAPEFNLQPQAFLRDMAADDEYAPIFAGLAALVHSEGRRLVLQLGNHDIELALPAAQQALLELLGALDPVARDRVSFETSGKGWVCDVGRRRILVVHGNEWDPWNVVDHHGLAQAAGARAASPLPKTNAGTTLVCGLVNRIKVDRPFVDLLKPETAPLMAVLAAVDAPTSVAAFAKALWRRLPEKNYTELLGAGHVDDAEPAGTEQGPERDMMQLLSSLAVEHPADGIQALQRAERHLESEERVRALVDDEAGHLRHAEEFGRARWQRVTSGLGRLTGRAAAESLRRALVRWLTPDVAFNVFQLSDIDRRIMDVHRPGIDLVIAGHTHMARQVPGYINTGTWMRVLRLNGTRYLRSESEFRIFFDIVNRQHTLQELDALGDLDPRQRPVAVVDAQGGLLFSAQADGSLKQVV